MTRSKIVVCTVLEPHYLSGFKALVNSLWQAGFRGQVYVGYKGQISENDIQQLEKNDFDITICFVRLATEWHLANMKPHFMLDCVARSSTSEFDRICYFDPDIVLTVGWKFLEDWTKDCITVCEDINSPVPLNHPLQNLWHIRFPHLPVVRKLEQYFNSGFICVPFEERKFLDVWREVNDAIYPCARHELLGLDCDRAFWVCKSDQDAMNISLHRTDCKFSCHDRSGMMFSFIGTGAVMAHAIGGHKPWSTDFISNAIRGLPPSRAARHYFDYVDEPIKVFPPTVRIFKKISLKVASAIGRFYRRVGSES